MLSVNIVYLSFAIELLSLKTDHKIPIFVENEAHYMKVLFEVKTFIVLILSKRSF